MTDSESVQPAMDKSDKPAHSVDYYYLKAMRYLTCEDHHSDDSDSEQHCNCRVCRNERGEDDDNSSTSSGLHGNDNDLPAIRERSWSHSNAEAAETISQLPNLDGKVVGGRLKNRRYSDGMLLKQNMKITNGHVQWADDCKKELTRCRPRKQYVRNPAVNQPPKKSILKHSSQESLVIQEDAGSSDES